MRTTSQLNIPNGQNIEVVITEVQKGDKNRFAEIVETFQQPIYRYCCHMLRNKQDAEDAAQDVLVKAYQSICRYKQDVSFSAWLYRIACNHCLNLIRRRRLQIHVMRFFSREDAAASPEQELDDRLYSYSLSEALKKLSLEERNILVLRVFEQLSFVEMSQILNISPNALHKRMDRIKKKVRVAMTIKEEITCNEQETIMNTRIL